MAMIDLFDVAPLTLTLNGFMRRIHKLAGVDNFTQQYHNNWKQGLRARAGSKDGTKYPYGGFKLTSITPEGEKNIVNMARVGTGTNVEVSNNNATLVRSFMFPVKLSLDCVIKFSDAKTAMQFSMAMAIMLSTRALTFKVRYAGNEWACLVAGDGGQSSSVTMPYIDDLNEGSTPGSAEVQFSLSINTKCGFTRNVAKLNNYGLINMTMAFTKDVDSISSQELGAIFDGSVVETELIEIISSAEGTDG